MFHTFPEAKSYIPSRLVPPGVQAFSWVELSLQVPYFLVELSYDSGDWRLFRRLLCSDIEQLVAILNSMSPNMKFESLCALCPAYMTGLNTYTSEEIVEIWSSPTSFHNQMYKTKDGRKLQFGAFGDDSPEGEMDLVWRIQG